MSAPESTGLTWMPGCARRSDPTSWRYGSPIWSMTRVGFPWLSPAEQLVRRALEQFQTAETAEAPLRAEAQLDLEFLNLQQWKTDDQLDRESHEKPTLVIDQIGEPYRQLVGSLRRAHPGIQGSPVDSGAGLETPERYQGAIRHIERIGGAKAAREEAFKGAVGPGWGYYRLYTEYVEDEGRASDPEALFDQA